MLRYDYTVVGSGIGGMTIALLLSLKGYKVLLLEKSHSIGGSLKRFKMENIPFDTGFHFTGGFAGNSILNKMLAVLGISSAIKPEFIESPEDHSFYFEKTGNRYNFPMGINAYKTFMKRYFSLEKKAIDIYFDKIEEVIEKTKALDLKTTAFESTSVEEDYISLKSFLDQITDNEELKSLLSAYSLCYGTEPSSISFANHAKVVYSLYESVARVKKGGDSFIESFMKKFEEYDVDVRTGTFIDKIDEIEERTIKNYYLNTGEKVSSDNLIFTIHPQEILKTFPKFSTNKAFKQRVNSFEPSIGFFSVFLRDKRNTGEPCQPAIHSLFPNTCLEDMYDPEYKGDLPLVLVKSSEEIGGIHYNVINAFEVSCFSEVSKWENSYVKNRPHDYYIYKKNKVDSILKRIYNAFPEFKNRLEVLDSASILTYRDYLNNPYGSAYGIKQKIGQFSLFGRLPFRNAFVTGQSSILPGLLGTMVSSFLLFKKLIGKDNYLKFIEERMR